MKPRKNLAISITLPVLAVLIFSGCGERNAGSFPEPSSSSSSAASSMSGSATVPESGDATEHYSGGSKAPEGEYRPADEQGPAQNVPKPVQPEGMNEETAEGLEKFILYWNDCVNYGIQTGDFSYAEPLVAETYQSEHELYIWANEIYNRDGWIEGGLRTAIVLDSSPVAHDAVSYKWAGNLDIEDMRVQLDGPGDTIDWSHTRGQRIYFEVNFNNSSWRLSGIEVAK
ncbi:DUF6318 family protein [Rothia sp. P4278]|uniref:DUF6318 family protein n=1 Tax=Rothia sp. P4278 TaxID=3402658 RepID=UPI003AE8AD2D